MSFFTVEPEASGAPDGEKSGKAVGRSYHQGNEVELTLRCEE